MVGEFPELQGIMGGYYALGQAVPEHPAVAAAIRDHYKPVGQGDAVPTDPVTVAVSLADKLDTLVGFFTADLLPTGSKDPFALRRAMLGVLAIIVQSQLRFRWVNLFAHVAEDIYPAALRARLSHLGSVVEGLEEYRYPDHPDQDDYGITAEIITEYLSVSKDVLGGIMRAPYALDIFLIDRLKVQQREAGVRHDLIDAVFALGGEDDLVRLLARVHALQAFIGTADGANLLAGYKRAANILKKEGYETPSPHAVTPAHAGVSGEGAGQEPPEASASAGATMGALPPTAKKTLSYTPDPAEDALITALDSAGPLAAAAVDREDFEGAMAALASLRAPIDRFFETVIVNDPDAAKRNARLALLARVRDAVHSVADFSRIEG